jgi:MoxR-like ATPase
VPTEATDALIKEIQKVYIGHTSRVELALVALLAGGHVIIEDVPGVGKTVLAHAVALALECKFRRVQFTSDMLPADLLGVNVYDQKESRFVFRPGPLFGNIVLCDEINRTTPRTQSSLLEAMNDGHITVDGRTYTLPQPFCVLATQNPFEFEGTYPLPESQLDRFFIRMELGYPSTEQGKEIIRAQRISHPIEDVRPVMTREEIVGLQALVRRVHVAEQVMEYIMAIVEKTRHRDGIVLGVSPRGGVHLYRAAQALAVIRGRDYVEPDEVKQLAVPVLAHRIRCGQAYGAPWHGFAKAVRAIEEILDETPVPL